MALFLALTLFQHLINGFHNRQLRAQVVDLLGVTSEQYTASQMTYDLRRLRLKGLIFRPPKTHRYFWTPHGWKIARLFSPAGGARVPSRRGDVHQQRCRSAFPASGIPQSRRCTARRVGLPGIPAS
jgi:hypothetical protein